MTWELRTFAEMHADCNRAGHPCVYYGDRGDWWVAAGQHRDSDVTERSNFRVMTRRLEAIEASACAVEREDHWAVGWVEHLLVNPHSKKKGALRRQILAMHQAVEEYPILDETDHSELENQDCEETWQNCFSTKDRVRYLRDRLRAYKPFRTARRAVAGDWSAAAELLPYPSDLICEAG